MRFSNFALFAMIIASPVVPAQTIDSNSITVTVSRSMDVRADTALFALSVSTGLDSDLTSITTALTGAGIQNAAFVGVTDNYGYVSGNGDAQTHTLLWRFSYSVPYAQIKDTLAKLSAAATSLSGRGRTQVLTFSLNGSTASDTAVADARRKLAASLVDDAKKEAALVADSAGMALGQILGISDAYGGLGVSLPGNGAYIGIVPTSGGSAAPTVSVSSALTVKFAAGR